jgi:hypothetical protein
MIKLQQLLNKHGSSLEEDGILGPRTLGALTSYIRRTLDLPNLDNLLVGLRTDGALTNTFDDYLYCNAGYVPRVVKCSTTPGSFWIKNFTNPKGVAILRPGYYKNSHRFITDGNWRNLWLGAPYFQQIKPVTVYRDKNKDNKVDNFIIETGLFGINIHRGGLGSLVDRWSAGCIVVPDELWFKVVSDFAHNEIVSLGLLEL